MRQSMQTSRGGLHPTSFKVLVHLSELRSQESCPTQHSLVWAHPEVSGRRSGTSGSMRAVSLADLHGADRGGQDGMREGRECVTVNRRILLSEITPQ